jgi:hypothetical protein
VVIKGYGPGSLTAEAFTVTTDAKGYGKVVGLRAGEYGIDLSAPGYELMRTHFTVEDDKATKVGASLHATTVPREESEEVLKPMMRPGYTLDHGYVSDSETGEPIAGVKVRFVKGRVDTYTDSIGHYYLSTPIPAPEYSNGVGTDTLIYEKPGYKTITIKNLIVDSEAMGGGGADMEKGSGKIDIDATHKLLRDLKSPGSPKQKNPENDAEKLQGVTMPTPELRKRLSTPGIPFAVGPTPAVSLVTVPSTIRVGHNCTKKVCTTSESLTLETYGAEWLTSRVGKRLGAGLFESWSSRISKLRLMVCGEPYIVQL